MPTTNGLAEVTDFRCLETSTASSSSHSQQQLADSNQQVVSLYQELRMINRTTGKECLTRRWFYPVDAVFGDDDEEGLGGTGVGGVNGMTGGNDDEEEEVDF
jgi:hypothetical protein